MKLIKKPKKDEKESIAMSVFGIKATGRTGKVSYWVGEDSALFDWLLADDYEPSDLPSRIRDRMRIVRAPEGYAFHYGSSLLALDSEEAEALKGAGLSDKGHVTAKSPRDDKAHMSFHLLQKVTLAEFEALSIDIERILDVELY